MGTAALLLKDGSVLVDGTDLLLRHVGLKCNKHKVSEGRQVWGCLLSQGWRQGVQGRQRHSLSSQSKGKASPATSLLTWLLSCVWLLCKDDSSARILRPPAVSSGVGGLRLTSRVRWLAMQ